MFEFICYIQILVSRIKINAMATHIVFFLYLEICESR